MRTGSVLSSDPRAAAQAASIGATIGADNWWYAGPNTPGKKEGERLLPEEADALTVQAGTAIEGPDDDAHDTLFRDKNGRAVRGDVWKQGERSRPLARAAGAALVTGGIAGGGLAGLGLSGAAAQTAGKVIPQAVNALTKPSGGNPFGGAVDWLGGNGGTNALGLAGGLNAAYLGQKSSNFADMAGKTATDAWDAKAPLRVAGIQGMLAPKVADTSALRRISARGNPFALADKPQPAGGY